MTDRPVLEMALASVSAAPKLARDAVRRLAADAPVALLDDAVLLTSEIVTNAVNHAVPPCRLWACFTHIPLLLRVEVTDCSTALLPRLADVTPPDVGGWGIRLVDRLATRWGVIATPRGKTVWFELTDEANRRS